MPPGLECSDEGKGGDQMRYLTYVCGPLHGRAAVIEGAVMFAIDVTATVQAQGSPPSGHAPVAKCDSELRT